MRYEICRVLVPLLVVAGFGCVALVDATSLACGTPLPPGSFLPFSSARIPIRDEPLGIRDNCPDAGEPLLLTPYIEQNQTALARQLATVSALPDDAVGTRSYSGFLTVNESDNGNLFFWLFESTNVTLQQLPPSQVPLIIYLEGGPGVSSLWAAFNMNGPFNVDNNSKLYASQFSMTNLGRVLYIDNPVGTGFSFTNSDDGFSRDEEQVSSNLYNFLLQFYQIFPDLLSSPLYITGESYAGKYVPALAYKIYDERHSTFVDIPLAGVMIGDPWSDPRNMVEAYGPLMYNLGMANLAQLDYINNSTANMVKLIDDGNLSQAFAEMDKLVLGDYEPYVGASYFWNITGSKEYIYDAVQLPVYSANYLSYLSRCDVHKALHIGNLSYEESFRKVFGFMCNDFLDTVRPLLPAVFNNYRALIYNGQTDILVGAPLTENMLRALDDGGWVQHDEWLGASAAKAVWKSADKSDAGNVAGYVTRTSNGQFYYAVVRGAGHSVQYDQPLRAYDLYQRFINNETFN